MTESSTAGCDLMGSIHPLPRTRSLLGAVFQDAEQARQWLARPNPALGCAPAHLIAGGRERELQTYLSGLLTPAEPPPAPFDSLFQSRDRPPT
jgi:hypothetical protein